MLTSVLSPIQIAQPNPAPPWGWNPAATFLTAYNTQQENQRAQEKMAMEQELYRILLPQKQAEVEFNLKQLAYDSKLLEESYRARSADLDARYRAATSSGRSGSGSGSNAAGNVVGGTGQQQQSNPYGFGLGNIATPKAPQPAAPKKVSWRVVAPAQPQGTQGP